MKAFLGMSSNAKLPVIADKGDLIRHSTVRRKIVRRRARTPKSRSSLTNNLPTSPTQDTKTFPKLSLFKQAAKTVGRQAVLSRKKTDIADVWLQEAAESGVDSDTFYTMYKTARNGSYGGLWRREKKSSTNPDGSTSSLAADRKPSPRSAYIEKLDELKLAPELKPIAKQESKVDLLGYSLGDERMTAVAASLRLKDFSSLNVGSNRLGFKGAVAVIEAISTSCSELDISCNKMGNLGCRSLADDVLASPHHELITLNLASNDIGDSGLEHLCEGFKRNRSLKRLNLNSNKITEVGGNVLADTFTNTTHLEELCVAWNNLDLAAAVILERIKSLQHLDISSNSLGIQSVKDFEDGFNASSMANDGSGGSIALALRIAGAVAKNDALRHLDLRDNSFSGEAIKHIADGLKENHTLLGIHITHPAMELDACQFLRALPKQENKSTTSLATSSPALVKEKSPANKAKRSSPKSKSSSPKKKATPTNGRPKIVTSIGVELARNSRHAQRRNSFVDTETGTSQWLRLPNTLERKGNHHNCWICQGWTETELTCVIRYKDNPERYKAAAKDGVKVHLSIDAFHGEVMYTSKNGAVYDDQYLYKPTTKTALPEELAKQNAKHEKAARRARRNHGKTIVGNTPGQSVSEGEDSEEDPPKVAFRDHSRDPKDLHFELFRCLPPGSKIYFYFSVASERTITKEVEVVEKKKGKKGGGGTSITKRLMEETQVTYGLFTASHYRCQSWSPWSHKAYELMSNIRPSDERTEVHELVPGEVNTVKLKRRDGPLRITRACPRVFNTGDKKVSLSRFCWSLKSSIFAPRAVESDSHSFFSTEAFVKRMVHADWRYSKLGGDDGVLQYKFNQEPDPEALEMVMKASADRTMIGFNLLFKRATALHCGVYCDPFTIKRNAYTTILDSCKLFESVSMRYRDGFVMSLPLAKKEIDLIFITTNLESDSNKDAEDGDVSLQVVNDDNPDNALNRFEWLEALVQIAMKRFRTVNYDSHVKSELTVAGKEYKNVYVGDALPLLLDSFMKELGNPKSPDHFRRYFLYKENVDVCFHALKPELQRLFNVACGRLHNHNHGYMSFKQWMSLLSEHTNDLVPNIVSLEVLRRVFINSKMDSLQCVKSEKIQGLNFVDFLECMARLALIVFKPKKIDRDFSICIARFFRKHFSSTQLEHGRTGKVSNLAKSFLKKKDSKAESGYVNDFEEEHRQEAIDQVMSHMTKDKDEK